MTKLKVKPKHVKLMGNFILEALYQIAPAVRQSTTLNVMRHACKTADDLKAMRAELWYRCVKANPEAEALALTIKAYSTPDDLDFALSIITRTATNFKKCATPRGSHA